jgi:hypothetical protein
MAGRKSHTIPLLITMDLEIAYDHDLREQKQILERLGDDLHELRLPVTVFATADAVKAFPDQVNKLKGLKHEFGLHGMTHSYEEDYSKLSSEKIHDNISNATAIIETVSGNKPRCFRGPFMTTSMATQKALIENGFIADFSVCSQRIDLFNASGFKRGWLSAPRKPYFPSEYSPFKKGKVPLVVVPLSCVGLPFVSGVLYLLGFQFTKMFYSFLLLEANWFSKPIVYMFHSYEFTACRAAINQKRLHRLYIQNREKRYQKNLMLLKYMSAGKNIQLMTGSEYIRIYHDMV